jgi:hypothetical protein
MIQQPKPAPKPFGQRVGDSLFSDGKGGTLTRRQYDAAVKELHEKAVKYQDSHGMPQ